MNAFRFHGALLIAALFSLLYSACDSPLDVQTPRNRFVDRVSVPEADYIGSAVSVVLPPDTSGNDTTAQKIHFSVALVVDASGSITEQTALAFREGCNALLDSLDGEKDEGVVVFFTQTATIAQHITSQVSLLRSAVDNIPSYGATAMWDGIYKGMLELQSKATHARRAVIIITDSDDNSSVTGSPSKITSLGQSAKIPVYSIALRLTSQEVVLRNIAQSTGGQHYSQPFLSQIDDICREIVHKLKTP
ncbi:MAG: VWA domain-containing protein [Bacteroidetes bacterium]|nr:VWA domain-containing protein [Bacteroidota bacterium]